MDNKIKLAGFPLKINKRKADHLITLYDAIYFVSGQMEQFRNDPELYQAEKHLDDAHNAINEYLKSKNCFKHFERGCTFSSIQNYFENFASNSEYLRQSKGYLNLPDEITGE